MRIPSGFTKNKEAYLLALIYASIVLMASPVNLPLEDSSEYAVLGRNLLQDSCFCTDSGIETMRTPAYPAFIAAFMLLSGELYMKLLPAVISFFMILMAYFFTLEFTEDKRTSLLTSYVFASLPLVFYNSLRLLSDMLFLVFTVAALWMYVRFLRKGSRKALMLWPVFTAAAFLSRFTGVILIVFFLIHLLSARQPRLRTGRLKTIVVFLLVTAIILSPWVLWRASFGTIGEFIVLDDAVSNEYSGLLQINIMALRNGESMNTNNISLDTSVPIQLVTLIRIIVISFILITPLISAVFLYRLFRILRKNKAKILKRREYLLLAWIFTFVAIHTVIPYPMDSRYLLPITLPMTIIFSGFLLRLRDRKLFVVLIALQLFLSFSIVYADSQLRWTRAQTTVFYEAGSWIRDNTAADSTVLALGAPAIEYFSDRKMVGPDESPDYVVESDYSDSIGVDGLTEKSGAEYYLIMEFSDQRYIAKIYSAENQL